MHTNPLQKGIFSLILLLVMTIFYFSLIPSPNLHDIRWLPEWLGVWADANPDLRTAVPFALLGFLWPLLLVMRPPEVKDETIRPMRVEPELVLLGGFAAIFIILMLAETGQMFLQLRNPSMIDVFWGGVGIFSGGLMGFVFSRVVPLKGKDIREVSSIH